MNYRPRKGIILLKICDANLLVPLREASDVCSEIASISVLESLIWKQLEKGTDTNTIISLISKLAFSTTENIQARIESFLQSLYRKGFIVTADDACSVKENG